MQGILLRLCYILLSNVFYKIARSLSWESILLVVFRSVMSFILRLIMSWYVVTCCTTNITIFLCTNTFFIISYESFNLLISDELPLFIVNSQLCWDFWKYFFGCFQESTIFRNHTKSKSWAEDQLYERAKIDILRTLSIENRCTVLNTELNLWTQTSFSKKKIKQTPLFL